MSSFIAHCAVACVKSRAFVFSSISQLKVRSKVSHTHINNMWIWGVIFFLYPFICISLQT